MAYDPAPTEAYQPSAVADVAAADSVLEKAKALARLTGQLTSSARQAGSKGITSGSWITGQVMDLAPHLPARDLAALQAAHPGAHGEALTGGELADDIVASAAKRTAAIGAAAGAAAAFSEASVAAVASAPVQMAAETLAVVAVELAMIADLHTAAGIPLPSSRVDRGQALLKAWTQQRGLKASDLLVIPGRGHLVGVVARRQLSDRLLRRFVRGATSWLPAFIGSAAAGTLNGRATRKLAEKVRADLEHESSWTS